MSINVMCIHMLFFFSNHFNSQNLVPSQAPTNFMVTATSSTSIRASWTLLPEYARHGTIKGYKLFYQKKDSAVSATMEPINNGTTLTKYVTGLDEYTEYEFLVLAFTSAGNGPKSSVEIEWTLEDGKIMHWYIGFL